MTENGAVLVASVSIMKDNEVLLIKEKINQWNFPSGRMEYGETIVSAACREVKEETGLDVKLTGTTGIYNFVSSRSSQVIMFHFTGEITGGEVLLEEGITESKWIKAADIMKMENSELREAKVIKQIANQLLNEKPYPIVLFHEPVKGMNVTEARE